MTADAPLLSSLLREVSRSFYLTLRVLPPAIRPPISLAYLLARASDTIADTEVVPRAQRLAILRAMRDGRFGPVGELIEHQALPAERALLQRLDECYRVWQSFDHHDQRCIRELLATIITGQMDDLEQFPENTVTALPDAAATERYTYLVAGCVGEFWTKMCRAHLPGMAGLDAAQGIRFGQGLQLVNILRDLPRDLRLGRCYLPVTDPARFLEPGNFPLLEPIYRQWLERAAEHLDAGWEYTLSIPASQKRLRLACVWPIWIGRKTIDRLRRANPLAADQRVKVSRWEVYAIIAESALLVGNDAGLDEADRRLRTGM